MSSSQEGSLMSLTAVLVTSLGVVSSVYTIIMNVYFIKKIGKTRQKMILFFYRLFLDVVYNVLAGAYMTFSILYSCFTEEFREHQAFIVYIGFPLQTSGAIRTIVALAISIERVLAIYTPIMFHNYRDLCPSILILLFSVFMGMFENLILYLFCFLNIPAIPRDCAVLRCAVDSCFFDYWTTDRSVLFALNFVFSGLLSTRLFFLNNAHRQHAAGEQSKINHIALIDAANVFLCDFLPTASNYIPKIPLFSFKNIGPYVYIIKLVGSAVESYFISKILKRSSARSSVVVVTRTVQN
ncbi:Serpentine Receptor, class BC (Class B-like) [Caenorhabditis elegans]|uniref:Serpentine Receptor, class BC (Class B-like) n=1 Tax=Caenorhabditis elegans TaxID=6239 RepID=Q5DX29_CAEEL|nr:Serpentine Receptor, class BC (Class B-like) [Caenorhabditis elegans]CCD63004.1 Serpentine Receptor, class BC (Class B-like) [Caenorhabditis elegans]|eukprot:NP_504926.2 Serpentine Receptor, class BC (class B-like) [Caenorhabditis elegans]